MKPLERRDSYQGDQLTYRLYLVKGERRNKDTVLITSNIIELAGVRFNRKMTSVPL